MSEPTFEPDASSPAPSGGGEGSSSPVIAPGYTPASVTDKIAAVVLQKTPLSFYVAFGSAFALMMVFLYSVGVLFTRGIGIWGINNPGGWGFAIINFVWWIG